MKALMRAGNMLIVLHMVGVLGLVGWLALTDRLSGQRLEQLVEMFDPTVTEQLAVEAQIAEAKINEEKKIQREQISGQGPDSIKVQLDQKREALTLAQIKQRRLYSEVQRLLAENERRQKMIFQTRQQLDLDRTAFAEEVEAQEKQTQEAGFQKTIELLQMQPPKQSKQLFMQWVKAGKVDQVTRYLAAMEARKAAAVLKELKTDKEVEVVALLMEKLQRP